MARTARKKSSTGIYHVILRGINKQQIFYDDEDYTVFIGLLRRIRKVSHYELYAYCLMGNHVHILIKVSEEPLETIFRRIGASYVYWYNMKYQRTGHLFQDRYRSEAVENEAYFLTVLRYILRNPVKAGLCAAPQEYPYSNARAIFAGDHNAFPCRMSGKELGAFISQTGDDGCMEISGTVRHGVTDSFAKELILSEFGSYHPVITAENRNFINEAVRHLSEKGVSIRQISRLTGISKSIVERALK